MKNLFRVFGISLLCAAVFAATVPGITVYAEDEIIVFGEETAPAEDESTLPEDPAEIPDEDSEETLFPEEEPSAPESDPFVLLPEEEADDTLFEEDLPLEIQDPEEIAIIEPAFTAVKINSTNFPNDNLRALITEQFDTNKNGWLTDAEALEAKTLDASLSAAGPITDLSGLSYLYALEELNLYGQKTLTISYSTVDLPKSSLKKLTLTNCSLLTTIDISGFSKLETLICGSGKLQKIKCCSSLKNLTVKESGSTFSLENFGSCTVLTSLSLTSTGIQSLTIKSPELTTLTCNKNTSLSSITLSKCTKIKKIDVAGNALNSLTLPSSTENLTDLNCSNNQLKTLTLPNCPSLKELFCNKNQLTSFSIGNNTAYNFNCSDNQLTSIKPARFGNHLKYLSCQNNNISSLTLTACPNLLSLKCSGNNLSALDITENASLIECYQKNTPVEKDGVLSYGVSAQSAIALIIDKTIQNKITCGVAIGHTYFPDETFRSIVAGKGIDKNQNGFISYTEQSALKTLNVSGEGIADLDGIQVFYALRTLDCSNNQITWLNLALLESLETLNCSQNPLTSIKWSGTEHNGPKNTLKKLNCSDTNLGALDPSIFAALEDLDCSYIGLSSLNVSSNGNLMFLNCAGNGSLTSLNVGNNTKLQTLDCQADDLKSLNLSKNTALSSVQCQFNAYMTSLTLPSGTTLKTLNCGFCQLSSLDVSKNTALNYLSCPINDISKLDVSACPALTEALMNGTRTVSSRYGYYIYKTGTSADANTLILDSHVKTTPDPTKLDAPVLTSVNNTSSGITIKWNSVKYAKAYRIYRKDDSSDEGWKKYKDVDGSSTSYTDKKVSSGTKYYYKMRCITEDRLHMASDYSNTKSILCLEKAVITAANNHASGVELKWGKVNGAEKYKIFRKTGSGSYEPIKTTSTLKYTDKNVESGNTYTYQVQAVCGSTSGYKSSPKEILFLSQPKITSVSAYTGKNVIKWDAVNGAATYRVFRKGPGDPSWIKIKNTGTLSYSDKEVVKGVEYTYSVRAIDSTGQYLSCYAAGSTPVKAK